MKAVRSEIGKGTGVKLHSYPETGGLHAEFEAGPGAETREVSDGLKVDLDADGEAVGCEIDRASRRVADMIGRRRSPAARTRTERAR